MFQRNSAANRKIKKKWKGNTETKPSQTFSTIVEKCAHKRIKPHQYKNRHANTHNFQSDFHSNLFDLFFYFIFSFVQIEVYKL